MRRFDLAFLLLATTCLIVGVSMGIWMGLAGKFQFAPVHAHLNLLGWASLSLFGLAYRVYPALSGSMLAPLHFGASCIGAVSFPPGIYLAMTGQGKWPAIIGASLWLLGAVLYLANLVRISVLAKSSGRPDPAPALAFR